MLTESSWQRIAKARLFPVTGAGGLLVAAVLAGTAVAAPGDIALMPAACGPHGLAGGPAMSADGRFVASTCTVGPSGNPEVFERDLAAGTTILVSRADGVDGDVGNGSSGFPAISADGRFVAFVSNASNLTPDDTDGRFDVFVRDWVSGTTTLVSRADGSAGAKGNEDSSVGSTSISADGRFVAFDSRASNLARDDRDRRDDVFVRDLRSGTTTVVSRASGRKGAKSNHHAAAPSISADGRLVAFISDASNLSPADRDHSGDVFVRDLRTSKTTLVSRASGAHGAKGHGARFAPVISGDGRFVAFNNASRKLTRGDDYRTQQAFVRDLVARTTTLVTRATGAHGAIADAASRVASISADGRRVAFDTDAVNLSPYDTNFWPDSYVRDLPAHATTLVSQPANSGATGDSVSGGGSLSGDGRLVAFASRASNLTPDDLPGGGLFVRDLGPES